MVEDCSALVQGCQRCCSAMAPLCPIRSHAPLELMHIDFTSMESMMEPNKPPCIKNVLVIRDHFTGYALVAVTKDQTAKMDAKILYKWFITVFGMPTKLLSDCSMKVTFALFEVVLGLYQWSTVNCLVIFDFLLT